MTPWTAAHLTSLSFTISLNLLKFLSLESVMLSKHPLLYHPFLLLPSVFPSIRAFSSESALHIGWQKYRSFNFSISHSNEYSELISFGIYWFDLLGVQGTLKSLPQHHNLKASNVLRKLTLTYEWDKANFIIKCWILPVIHWILYWKWKSRMIIWVQNGRKCISCLPSWLWDWLI